MKVLAISLMYVFSASCIFAGDKIDVLSENIKTRVVKFDFKDADPDQLWSWIQLNLDLVANSQVEWGARKYGEQLKLRVISGIHEKISIAGNMNLFTAINLALVKYNCVAVIDINSIIIFPKSIQLDCNKYVLLSGSIYRVKQTN